MKDRNDKNVTKTNEHFVQKTKTKTKSKTTLPYRNGLNTVERVIEVKNHIPLLKQVLSLRSTSLLQQKPGNIKLGMETDSFRKNI